MFSCTAIVILLVGYSFATYDYCQAPPVGLSENNDGLELKFVQVITRHGDRTPAHTLPIENEIWNCTLNELALFSDDLSNNEPQPSRLYRKTYIPGRETLHGNCYEGQLTFKGLQQHFVLGSQFRNLYIDEFSFLPEELNLSNIWVRSTEVPRVIQSAQANLWGLYPPSSRPNEVGIIDINLIEKIQDDLTPNANLCPAYAKVISNLKKAPQYIQFQEEYAPLMSQIMKVFNSSTPFSWPQLVDNLAPRQCHGLPYPPGINDSMVDQILTAASWEFSYLNSDSEAGRLGMGFFLSEILQNIVEFIQDPRDPIYIYYSGHDTTVGPLMATLGVSDGIWPPYASHMEIELWQQIDGGSYFVQVKYNGEVPQLPGCSSNMCPYNEFLQFVSSRIPTNFDQECGIN